MQSFEGKKSNLSDNNNPDIHLRIRGPNKGMRDVALVLRMYLGTAEKKWTHMK
jgi:hypothetical protein